jgi:universal stress protein A
MAVHPYRHLLAAVDFSGGTESVAERAAELAQRYMARLSLVHVVEPTLVEYTGELALPEDLGVERQMMDSAQERLDEMGDRLHVKGQDRHLLSGLPRAEIVGLAEEADVDLIVVGSHGRHGLALLLGSTANAVLHHAPCDVVAVRIGGEKG